MYNVPPAIIEAAIHFAESRIERLNRHLEAYQAPSLANSKPPSGVESNKQINFDSLILGASVPIR